MNIKHFALSILAAGTALSSASAMAGFNEPIVFAQSGQLSITLDATSGGLDHVLELASTTGAIGASPIFYLSGYIPQVLGQPVSPIGTTVSLGNVTAGSELIFRLSNIQSERLNGPGTENTIDSQLFSGSASGLNPNTGDYYTLVEQLSPNSIRVTWEDLGFPNTTSPTTEADFKGGADLTITLTVTPVPEAGSSLMALAGLGVLGVAWVRRRRQG